MVDTADTGQIGINPSPQQFDLFGKANYPGQTVNLSRRHQRTLDLPDSLPAVRTQRV
ncbi:hypothetical protein D3C76_990570 [compost metagenome]